MGWALILVEFFGAEIDDLHASSFFFIQDLLILLKVNFTFQLKTTASAAGLTTLRTSSSGFLSSVLVDSMSICKLSLNLFCSCVVSAHPRMASNVGDTETLSRFRSEHRSDEVLKVITEVVCRLTRGHDMRLPEEVWPIHGQHLVVVVFITCNSERRMTSSHNEENHAKCEEINDWTLVALFL